jgi:hypothetical protein
MMAGIHPDDPSLYPQTLKDVFPFGTGNKLDASGGHMAQAD